MKVRVIEMQREDEKGRRVSKHARIQSDAAWPGQREWMEWPQSSNQATRQMTEQESAEPQRDW